MKYRMKLQLGFQLCSDVQQSRSSQDNQARDQRTVRAECYAPAPIENTSDIHIFLSTFNFSKHVFKYINLYKKVFPRQYITVSISLHPPTTFASQC